MKSVIQRWMEVLVVFTIGLELCFCEPESFFESFLNPSVVPTHLSSADHAKNADIVDSQESQDSAKPSDGVLDQFGSVGRQLSLATTQSFIQRRLFNTSVALTVPLFSFTLPQRATQGTSVDLANQAIFGLFALLVTTMVFTVPVLFTGVRPSTITGRSSSDQGTQGILDNLMASTPVLNLMGADMQHKIGLDSTKCLQKTICDAHRYPKNKHYGLLALPFQIFFPPPSNSTEDARASTLQYAARKGKYSSKECGQDFKCFFDILDLATYFVDWYRYTNDPDSFSNA